MDSSTRAIGNLSEAKAVAYMERLGFKIVEKNYYARKLGEIDIIATKDGVWHFIEVKSAKADFDPVDNFTPTKLRRVINSAHYYLKVKNLDVEFCIDALIIRKDEIEWIENITL
ncbi:MAG TPA: YraN family protein [Campylobacterales bacterium]|nr:YraN family protein [Campylobacterales bacterium]